ncbi:alpha/beta fold hydrolase [Candidatus Rhodoblastus alkanivorans]|uniref:Alpha/beta fold hydrolase n=2 Tax=Candidatus Rhodoblastus alkanivorans TaxID=2954117 RepID=A0ABS9ZAS6_9HYPH|nr:alpha/beta fold hydrolase [Candidatus Rhodoblastus alkanivorans]MCI4684575.1 alpha/beta fold hydrolase [Candidatus Rhodoblastus alkanivorans]
MAHKDDPVSDWTKLLWPGFYAAEAGLALARVMIGTLTPPDATSPRPEPAWASPNEVVLELSAARLRRFDCPPKGGGGHAPILVCAPFALHDARIADLCEGHSLMARLRAGGGPLYLVEWLSARETQAFRTIDDYLADLNVMVDEIGGFCDFVGLCQGGWLGLAFAARFPSKARRLVIAAAPIDTHAAETPFSALARSTPIETFEELAQMGGGFARGAQAQQFWGLLAHSDEQIHALCQSDLTLDSDEFRARTAAFRAWSESPLDLPGAYYLEVVERLYKQNQLARGEFVALGKRIDLRVLCAPLYLIAAQDDDIAAPEQTLACARLVGTPPAAIRQRIVPGGHLNLFFGRRTLDAIWPDVVAWLCAPAPAARRAKASGVRA